MRIVDDDIREAALSAGRHISLDVEIAANVDGTYIDKQVLTEKSGLEYLKISVGGDSDGITIGKTYCAQLVIKIPRYIDISEKDRLIVRVGYDTGADTSTGKMSLGWFYVDNIEINGFVATVTAYDAMLRWSKNYISEIKYPAGLMDVISELCTMMGVDIDESLVIPTYFINSAPIRGKDSNGKTLYYTRREMLGFLGSLMGGNWFINAGRHLKFTALAAEGEAADTISAENVIDSDINADVFTITGISWNTGDETYKRQDVDAHGVIEFYNPLDVSQTTIMPGLERNLVGKSYCGGTIVRQGAGWHEIGDLVNVPIDKDGNTKPILLTGIQRIFQNGAYIEKWQSYAKTESESNYSVDTTDKTDSAGIAQTDVYAVKTRDQITASTKTKYWGAGELRPILAGTNGGMAIVNTANALIGKLLFGARNIEISTQNAGETAEPIFKIESQGVDIFRITVYDAKTGINNGLMAHYAEGTLTIGKYGGDGLSVKFAVNGEITYQDANGKKYKIKTEAI